MRGLTEAEAEVIRSLLADEPVGYRERIRRSGLPRRTFETAYQRVHRSGWVTERFVPDPVRFGRPFVRLMLAGPSPDEIHEASRQWARDPQIVLLWESPDRLFAVRLERNQRDRPPTFEVRSNGGLMDVQMDLRNPTLPAFFDFEGAWSHLLGRRDSQRYPRSLAPGHREAEGSTPVGERELAAVEWLCSTGFASRSEPDLDPWRRGALRRDVARALKAGYVERRRFLDLTRLPGYCGRRIAAVGLVWGRLLAERDPSALFKELCWDHRIAPFLYGQEAGELVVGLASTVDVGPGPRASAIPAVLRDCLASPASTWISTDTLEVRVPHLYDRLFSADQVQSPA